MTQRTQARSVPAIPDCITASLAGQRISVGDSPPLVPAVLPPIVLDFALPLEMEPVPPASDVAVDVPLVLVVVLSPDVELVVEGVLLVGVTLGLAAVVVVVPEAAELAAAAPAVSPVAPTVAVCATAVPVIPAKTPAKTRAVLNSMSKFRVIAIFVRRRTREESPSVRSFPQIAGARSVH